MNRIAIVGITGLPARYGGFETLAEQLTKRWPNKNDRFICFCEQSFKSLDVSEENVERLFLPFKANGMQSLFFDATGIVQSILKKCDVILLLGVSGAWILPLVSLIPRSYRPLIVANLDGVEWKRDKWGSLTRILLKVLEKFTVRFSDVIIADNEGITRYLNEKYFIDPQQIAYGGDHALASRLATSVSFDTAVEDFFFALCRIEPENNVHLTLEAFRKTTDKQLVFIGNWQGSEYGKALFDQYHELANITLLDPVYDIGVLNDYRTRCVAFIHGHSAGGTNPSLVEYMFYGKQIFAFDCNFNRFTLNNAGCYFSDSEDLMVKLRSFDALDVEPSLSLKRYAVKNYNWLKITNKYAKVLRR